MESIKGESPSKRTAAFPIARLSVVERRLMWLGKRHPRMSRHARELWAFGEHSPRTADGTT